MNKRMFYKIVCILGMVSILAACTGATETPTPSPTQTQPPIETSVPSPALTQTPTELSPVDVWAQEIRSKLGGTEIKVAAASHPSTDAFQKMIPRFEELTGIKVSMDIMEENALNQKILLDASAAQPSYDVMMASAEAIAPLVQFEYLTPLDDFINDNSKTPDWFNNEDIVGAYREMDSYQGKQYAIPFAGETVFLFYRKDLFEKYGIEVPQTFDDVLKTAKFFKDKEPGLSGISMRTQSGDELTYMWSIFINPFGGEIINPKTGEPGFNEQGTIDSLQYMVDILPFGPTGIESYSYPEAWDAFMQGKTAMMIESSSAAAEVENPEKSVVVGKTGYAPLPAGPDGAYSGVWGWGYGLVNKSTKHDAAWAFIMYLTSQAMQNEYIADGGVVSRTSYLSDPANQAKFPYYKTTLDALGQAAQLFADNKSVYISSMNWPQMDDIMGTTAGQALAGQITVKEACANMQVQFKGLLGK